MWLCRFHLHCLFYPFSSKRITQPTLKGFTVLYWSSSNSLRRRKKLIIFFWPGRTNMFFDELIYWLTYSQIFPNYSWPKPPIVKDSPLVKIEKNDQYFINSQSTNSIRFKYTCNKQITFYFILYTTIEQVARQETWDDLCSLPCYL